MKPNPLPLAAALLDAAAGIALTFAPEEVVTALGVPRSPMGTWLGQLLGAALLGLAFANWMQRFTALGGIYGRPLLMTNLVFTLTAFFASLGAWRQQGGEIVLGAAILLGILGAAFGWRLFRPAAASSAGSSQRPS